MKNQDQLFNENRDLIVKFSCELSTRKYPAFMLRSVTEKFLREAIVRFGRENLQDFYYDAEEYIIDHLGLYVETNGKSLSWSEERIQASCARKKKDFTSRIFVKTDEESFSQGKIIHY